MKRENKKNDIKKERLVFTFFIFLGVFLGTYLVIAPPAVPPSIHGHPDTWTEINELSSRLDELEDYSLIGFYENSIDSGSYDYIWGSGGGATFYAFDITKGKPPGTEVVYMFEIVRYSNGNRGAYFSTDPYDNCCYSGYSVSPPVPYFYAYPSASNGSSTIVGCKDSSFHRWRYGAVSCTSYFPDSSQRSFYAFSDPTQWIP